ncbi:hypothetical protein [Arundinibacter roseus]|uniref:Uncharacterized protein n=1 Tax=Arundinibacter roseus TaxID=2070510 RepID=A0A4R4KIN6_9BACT|nr:hypothetical protein [Arundinibacter roseus]TDB68087.1 hypothetical protein EZE20_03970 [Arundinibacter roseus]
MSIKPLLILYLCVAGDFFSGQSLAQRPSNTCERFVASEVYRVKGSSTGKVSETQKFRVYFSVTEGCGEFARFTQTAQGNTYQVSVTARYRGCRCLKSELLVETIYTFKPTQKGMHYLQFAGKNGTFVRDSILIQ